MMEYTLTFTKPDGRAESKQINTTESGSKESLYWVFKEIEERLDLIKKNKEIISIVLNDETDKLNGFPSRGVYFSKDLMKRLNYILVDDVYEYYIYKAKLKMCGNKTKVKYKKVTAVGRFTDLNNFATYLYCEGFIDEKPKQIEQ